MLEWLLWKLLNVVEETDKNTTDDDVTVSEEQVLNGNKIAEDITGAEVIQTVKTMSNE